ncbi:hypothetical protein [Neobacillus notoginsengisoli]|uniref:hypothetical protein n=1 Tax=Neobacillus notoginsengisoli TaxID=1578198 RepID=UPI00115D8FB4|nr:hypothetical protein [Neobacillus notoginsengisoli]
MLKFLVFILIPVTLVVLAIFIEGLLELYKLKREEENSLAREGMEGYLDQQFGYKKVRVFKKIYDAEGAVRYMVYLPSYEWFKAPNYQWYEVFSTEQGYKHCEIER